MLQESLWAEHRHKVLVVLQGMDTSGKDGTIRHVFEGVNPLGVRVAAFKAPTAEELDHDFLWRVHPRMPRPGRDRDLQPQPLRGRAGGAGRMTWSRPRSGTGATTRSTTSSACWPRAAPPILKFFLHISKEEQRKRLQDRLDDPLKRWKFRLGDLEDRDHWDDYMEAYEDAPRPHQPRSTPPGTSSRPTRSGTATWWSPRSWSRRWRG